MQATLKEKGLSTRSSKGIIYLTRYEDKRVQFQVAIQVKGSSLTWYFWAPGAFDQYSQEFRDKIYNQATIAHQKVENGCDLYYRGSNSVHVKMMHHEESESGYNHNHYRLKDGRHYTPIDFKQHMMAFKENPLIESEFFYPGEIESICDSFETFYHDWNTPIMVAGYSEPKTKADIYFSQDSQKLNQGDIIELYLFGQMQEPCRIRSDELAVDYQRARDHIEEMIARAESAPSEDSTRVIEDLQNELHRIEEQYKDLLDYRKKGGSRGLNSAEASTRQVENSANEVIRARQNMDDSLGKEVPDIPYWAKTLQQNVKRSHTELLKRAESFKDSRPVADDDVVKDWIEKSDPATKHSVQALYGESLGYRPVAKENLTQPHENEAPVTKSLLSSGLESCKKKQNLHTKK